MTRVLLSIGDPNGIGPEIAVAAALRLGRAAPVLVGDRDVLGATTDLPLRDYDPALEPEGGVLDLVHVGALPPGKHRPGLVSAEAGAATIAYLRAAIELASSGGFRAVVAGPHSETSVHAAGIAFRGYPPMVAELTGADPDRVFLLLVGGGLRIVHVTLHERLAAAIARITPALVTSAGIALHEALIAFGVPRPSIGVFGINPHAGERGLFGSDDERVTMPSVAALRSAGIDARGPVGADVLLSQRSCDGYVAMYHDQGHVPIKLLAGKGSCALTIGAGVPFCTVGHGTAFDIAGTRTADPGALLAALRLFTPEVATR
jgi:4-hydroxythreonine-4-phosphate dehydrogenase